MITEKVVSWKSKDLSAEKRTAPTTTDNSLFPSIKWHENSNFCLIFKGSSLKKPRNFYPSKYNNFFQVYELDTWSIYLNSDFTLKDCLFGGAKLAKNADPDKYVYTVCGIGFDSCSEFSLPDGSVDENVIIFEIDMSSYMHIHHKKKDILNMAKVLHKD